MGVLGVARAIAVVTAGRVGFCALSVAIVVGTVPGVHESRIEHEVILLEVSSKMGVAMVCSRRNGAQLSRGRDCRGTKHCEDGATHGGRGSRAGGRSGAPGPTRRGKGCRRQDEQLRQRSEGREGRGVGGGGTGIEAASDREKHRGARYLNAECGGGSRTAPVPTPTCSTCRQSAPAQCHGRQQP